MMIFDPHHEWHISHALAGLPASDRAKAWKFMADRLRSMSVISWTDIEQVLNEALDRYGSSA